MSGDVEIRDERAPGWFWCDNTVFEICAKSGNSMAWAVYCTYARFGPGQRSTRPVRVSVAKIGEMWNCSHPTVKRANAALRKLGLIHTKKTQTVSIVTLLDVKQLDFTEKLFAGSSGEITTDPTKKQPDRSPVIRGRDHQRAVGGITNDPQFKTTSFKTTSLKTGAPGSSGGSSGIETIKSNSKSSPEKKMLSGECVKRWLEIKEKLKNLMPLEDWKKLVRPGRLLKDMGEALLVAIPPSRETIDLYWKNKKLLSANHIVVTPYPDDLTIAMMKEEGGPDYSWITERRAAKRKKA